MPRFPRTRAAMRRHPALLTIAAILVIAVPGYLRLEGIVSDLDGVLTDVKTQTERTDVIARQAQEAADQAKEAASQAQAAIDLSNSQRLDSRIAACNVDRNFAMGHNAFVKANEDGIGDLIATVFHLTAQNSDDATKAQIEALIKQLDTNYRALLDPNILPVRECDPASVEAFYQDQGDAP